MILAALQAVLHAGVRCRQPARAIPLANPAYAALGYDRLATPEVLLGMAAGDLARVKVMTEELAAAPVRFGGRGLRASVRESLGRYDEAVADGVAVYEEAVERVPNASRPRPVP